MKLNPPLFGGWTPTYEGDHCGGGHPPQSVYEDETGPMCGRCGRYLDLTRCLCGDETHRGGMVRSYCPTRVRFDKRDAENHKQLLGWLRG